MNLFTRGELHFHLKLANRNCLARALNVDLDAPGGFAIEGTVLKRSQIEVAASSRLMREHV